MLPDLIAAGLLRPLNHDYLPNVANLWSWFSGAGGPFYDPNLQFSVPYTVYSSGVGWRNDLVAPADAPDADDPFAIFWNDRYRGRLGIYDAYLEALSLALLRDGVVDLKSATDADLERAAGALEEAVRVAGVRFTIDGAEEGLPEGEFARASGVVGRHPDRTSLRRAGGAGGGGSRCTGAPLPRAHGPRTGRRL